VGLDVLTRLHDRWGSKPVTPDLDGLWRDLGLKVHDGGLDFEDAAPFAAVRKAITEPPSQ
jgi:hypothetical protein